MALFSERECGPGRRGVPDNPVQNSGPKNSAQILPGKSAPRKTDRECWPDPDVYGLHSRTGQQQDE
jgi:hypothetical protein